MQFNMQVCVLSNILQLKCIEHPQPQGLPMGREGVKGVIPPPLNEFSGAPKILEFEFLSHHPPKKFESLDVLAIWYKDHPNLKLILNF